MVCTQYIDTIVIPILKMARKNPAMPILVEAPPEVPLVLRSQDAYVAKALTTRRLLRGAPYWNTI